MVAISSVLGVLTKVSTIYIHIMLEVLYNSFYFIYNFL